MGRGNGTQSRWRVKTGVELGPSWDDGAAVFLASTAQTLALSPLATAVLEELTRLNSGADANELVAVLADSAELAEVERQHLAGNLEQVLTEFAALGVIAPV